MLVLSVLFVFFCMLQLLHLDVSKIDRMLYMEYVWEAAGGADNILGGVGDVRNGVGPLLVRSLASPMRYVLVWFLCTTASGC